jgi:uncharacterized protein (DUF433 family)
LRRRWSAFITRLDLKLTTAHKKRLLSKLAQLRPAEIRTARVELAPAVEIDVGRLLGDVMDRAERYRVTRDASIVIDQAIKGGTPVIRGTRITVYSMLGRIEHGETIDDILGDNSDLSREAVEAAITYARTHPLMGGPGGRHWANAAWSCSSMSACLRNWRRINAPGRCDAVHPLHVGRRGEPDHRVLAWWISEDRVIVTENARDFRRLVGNTELHPGLIILPAIDREGTWALLLVALSFEDRGKPMDVIVNHVLEVDESGAMTLVPLPL